MRRREFMAGLASAVAWPVSVRGQQAGRLPTIGLLGANATAWSSRTTAFVTRLRELGWIEGRTIVIEYRWEDGRPERAAEIAAEFVRLKAEVIVTVGSVVAALKRVTRSSRLSLRWQTTRSAAAWSQVWRGRAATSRDYPAKRRTLPANGSNFCERSSPRSAGWQFY